MAATGKKGKMKKSPDGKSYSNTGTTTTDWYITDPSHTPPSNPHHMQVKKKKKKSGPNNVNTA